jgi:2-haloacid dehalogenase
MPVLHKLHGKFSLGILSNANHVMLRAAVAHNDLGDYFDQILSADQVKLFKPRPEVYQLACDQFKLSPEEIIFVSSNTWDVIGAKSFGFKTVWLNRSGAVMEALGFSADHMLEKMEQLTPKHVAFLQD